MSISLHIINFFLYKGNLYFADQFNFRIRKVTVATGIISTIAGIGSSTTGTFSGDGGAATSALLYAPQGVVVDSSGIARIYKLSVLK